MNGTLESATSPAFKWSLEYGQILETLASSDYLPQDWDKLRDMIKYRLKENIASYLSDPPPPPPPEPPAAPELPNASPQSASTVTTLSPGVIPTTGAKFPPFPKREESAFIRNEFNSYGKQKIVLTEEEAKEAYGGVCRLLHEFEGHPPFTIQRVCELIIRPRQHFKYLGKYLRAVERSLLVTSTIDAFPIIGPEENAATSSPFISVGSLREATTPLFSPIPFLHEDARRSRSRSRSPPMSPLNLATSTTTGTLSPSPEPLQLGPAADATMPPDTPVIGLVDELDDPGPGHLSDHPTAISSTTTATGNPEAQPTSTGTPMQTDSAAAAASGATPKALFGGSLQERFVKSSSGNGGGDAEMSDDDPSSATSASTSARTVASGAGPTAAESGLGSNSGEALSSGGGGAEAVSMVVDENDADKENVPKS